MVGMTALVIDGGEPEGAAAGLPGGVVVGHGHSSLRIFLIGEQNGYKA